MSSLRWSSLFLLLALSLFIAACGGSQANGEPTPPTIHYGEDIGEYCNMIISEKRYAAGYITSDGQEHIFDDVGDMILNHLKKQDDITAFFVHDHNSQRWIRAETAYFSLSPDLPTPMLSGLAAFTTLETAESFAAELNGTTLTFDELLTYYRENPPSPAFPGLPENQAN